MENKDFIFVNRQNSISNTISTFGGSEVLKMGEAPQSHNPKTIEKGPYCMCFNYIELLSENWI